MNKFQGLALISVVVVFVILIIGCSDGTTEPNENSVATPVIDPPTGNYNSTQTVSITTTTLGATIVYTLDGNEPNSASTAYAGPFQVTPPKTVKAKAFKSGMQDSATASAIYTLTGPPLPEFVLVEGGTFNNGTSDITISSFHIAKYELTQSAYQVVMGTNPSYFLGVSNGPVERVTWYDAIEYCNRRSLLEGLTPCYSYSSYGSDTENWPVGWNTDYLNHSNVYCSWTANGYRLPTEMEWQFAARGGNQTHNYSYSGSNDLNQVGWYYENSGWTTHTVGSKAANELGTFDMSGNVWEWVWDIYGSYPGEAQTDPHGATSGSYRVYRGGGFAADAGGCTVSIRYNVDAADSSHDIGFRICRVSP